MLVWSLAATALLVGLAGGPHCAAMCGAACAGVMRGSGRAPARAMASFQFGRLFGYSAAGGAIGFAVQSFAWLSAQASMLRPLTSLIHLAVLAWGLALLVLARQPAWVDTTGRAVWSRVRPIAQARGGVFATGALWALMPCGLLYSAFVLASLAGGAWQGALVMAAFAAGSGVALGLFPELLRRLQAAGRGVRGWGPRAAGALLVGVAGWALWHDLALRIAQWCAP
jgi:sulfite exporter TauE/SafE